MSRLRSCAFLAASLVIVGCSIHPLPDDVTRDSTEQIINKIRCEARDALVKQVIDLLNKPVENGRYVSPAHQDVLDAISTDGSSEDILCHLQPLSLALNSDIYGLLKKFSGSSVAYIFKFDITENKVKGGSALFKMPFTKGTFTVSAGAASNKSRQGVRQINLSETFSSLLLGYTATGNSTNFRCADVRKKLEKEGKNKNPRKHWNYPITGKIGVDEVIDTFIRTVNTSHEFASLSDLLTYTTTFQIGPAPGINSTISLNDPRSGQMKLTRADARFTASRKDVHSVQITLAPEPNEPRIVQSDPFNPLSTGHEILGFGAKQLPNQNKALSLSVITGPAKPAKAHPCTVMSDTTDVKEMRGRTGRPTMVRMGNPLTQTPEQEQMSLDAVEKESDLRVQSDNEREFQDLIGR